MKLSCLIHYEGEENMGSITMSSLITSKHSLISYEKSLNERQSTFEQRKNPPITLPQARLNNAA